MSNCSTLTLCDPDTGAKVLVTNPGTAEAEGFELPSGTAYAGDLAALVKCDEGGGELPEINVNDGAYGSSRPIADGDILLTEEQPHDPAGWPLDAALCPVEDGKPVYKSAIDGKFYVEPECKPTSELIGFPFPPNGNLGGFSMDDLFALNGGASGAAQGGVTVEQWVVGPFCNDDACGRPKIPKLTLAFNSLQIVTEPDIQMFYAIRVNLQPAGTGAGATPAFPTIASGAIVTQGVVNSRGQVAPTQSNPYGSAHYDNKYFGQVTDAGDCVELILSINLAPFASGWADTTSNLTINSGFSGPGRATIEWCCP